MSELILDAPQANFSLSPTGLVIGVSGPAANVQFSSNFTNDGSNRTVRLRAELNATDGSNRTYELSSSQFQLERGQSVLLQTSPASVPPGAYNVSAQVLDQEDGAVLDSRTLQVQVASSETGFDTAQGSPALFGIVVVLIALTGLVVGKLNSARKDFGQ